jgi:CubicO group peptidase (beta-lactamase class C family)
MTNFNKKRLKEEIADIVQNGLKKNIFSGACISFYKKGENFEWRENYSFGYISKLESQKKVYNKTCFDLASLTKPLVTVLSLAVLIEKGQFDLHDNISDCCCWSLPDDKKKIKISHLLSHSSGLPAHKPYYKELSNVPLQKKQQTLINWIVDENLCFLPGTSTLYSDLGFMLLGFLVEEVTGLPLDVFWKENVIAPLGLQKGLLFPKKNTIDSDMYVATKNCQNRDDSHSGVVHDYNCRAMGGVGGHAGLFGTGPAVLSLCEHIIKQFKRTEKHPLYSSSLLIKILKKQTGSSWAYGFDTPAKENSSSGFYFNEKSRGHLGFTGTSFWLDFDREIAIVVLTNRVHLSNNINGIRWFRPLLYNTIMKRLCTL